MTEEERFRATVASKTPDIILRNVRRLLPRWRKKIPNWVLAKDVFSVGSTYAHGICIDNGLDPDAMA
jgi:hypothetical protein